MAESNLFFDAATNSMTAQMMTAWTMMGNDGKDDDDTTMMVRMMTRREDEVEEEARGRGGSEPLF